ncbi:hypothetical protein JHK82_038092 [Glycine max]|uniref:B-like cyclin n=1 Tax=Glycine max TaxID=3847 RepID=A0A0R0GY30_SOYBN|nr:hypothetical protein JHK85_038840 [Glycine max]KAG4978807.1 hypothetical protein JHK86_038281 [Glycine max]KAG5114823.1 hypothetical protein JHK82_038092 [Glycine max]KAG5132104.1 hypothetical protein JHK84_038501 [Glycine max]
MSSIAKSISVSLFFGFRVYIFNALGWRILCRKSCRYGSWTRVPSSFWRYWNFNAKLLANEEVKDEVSFAISLFGNELELNIYLCITYSVNLSLLIAESGKRNLIVPALDNAAIVHQEHGAEDSTHKPNPEPVDMVNFEAEDSANFVCERGSRERSRRNVKTLTSEIIAQSKKACVVLNDTKEEPVDMDADDPNEVVVAEYLEDIYRFFNLTEVPAILKSYSFHIYVFILLLLQLMMQQETDYQASDYMKKQHGINDKMRSIIVDWLVENPHEISINA